MWSAILGSAALGALDVGAQYAANKSLMKRQHRFSERMYRSRYQMTRADMEAAGYNPILAMKQGPGAAPSGVGASVSQPQTAANASRLMQTKTAQVALEGVRTDNAVKEQILRQETAKADFMSTDAWIAGQTAAGAWGHPAARIVETIWQRYGSDVQKMVDALVDRFTNGGPQGPIHNGARGVLEGADNALRRAGAREYGRIELTPNQRLNAEEAEVRRALEKAGVKPDTVIEQTRRRIRDMQRGSRK